MRVQFTASVRARRPLALAALGVALLLLACSSKASGGAPAVNTPLPVATVTLGIPGSDGQPADGIQCQTTEQLAYHIHAHLALIVDGQSVAIPKGIGIAPPRTEQQGIVTGGSCFYWLHTHDTSGVIHIESPTSQVYTLGQFFAVWGQPLSETQVATFPVDANRPLRAYVNGKPFTGSPDQIPLGAHDLITLMIGEQVPPPSFTFPPGL